jgi:3-oxoacyl-(acyl-carrier-protein) synthase
MSARVFVAGRGAVTAFGPGRERLAAAIFLRETALLARRRLADVDCLTSVAGEVSAPTLAEAGSETELPFHLARAAAREAIAEARTDAAGLAFVLATTKGDLSGVVGPGTGLGIPQRLAQRLAADLGTRGTPAAVSCACASGLSALALAGRWIRQKEAERVLVVGTDALSAFILRGFSCLLALDDGPCRPFDRDRAGLSLGEAAGAILLTGREEESLGIEIAGWGESNAANHITGPSRDGTGLFLAASRALRRAGADPGDVDYIHLHGTGTTFNDAMEGKALVRLFEEGSPPASGTKAQTGHTLGAAGVIESLIAIEVLERGRAPGNVGLEEPDLDRRIDLLRADAPLPRARLALKVSAGFGGINAAMVFRR